MNDHSPLSLPPWYSRPRAVTAWQPSLFQRELRSVIVGMRVSLDEIARWHARGWLSFDGSDNPEVDEWYDPRVWELTVVRDIVRSGLGDAQIDYLLSQLPRPYAIDPDRLAFSFRHGWVQVNWHRDPDPDEVIEEHVDSWLEGCDADRLWELRERIDELLEERAETPTEDEE